MLLQQDCTEEDYMGQIPTPSSQKVTSTSLSTRLELMVYCPPASDTSTALVLFAFFIFN